MRPGAQPTHTHTHTHTETPEGDTARTDQESSQTPDVSVPARQDHYSIVISTAPVTTEDEDDQCTTTNWEEGSIAGSEWTDLESEQSITKRQSLLPKIGAFTGVCKDLATERARDFLNAGKEALESSKTLKRELRAVAVENLGNLYSYCHSPTPDTDTD
jgi:hypothetical protein